MRSLQDLVGSTGWVGLAGWVAVVWVGLMTLGVAQEPQDKFSGKPGEFLPGAFPALIVSAPAAERAIDQTYDIPALTDSDKNIRDEARVGKIHCPVTRIGVGPMVAVFARTVPDPDSPLGKLVKQLEPILEKNRSYRPGAFITFLTLSDQLLKDAQAKDKLAAARRFTESVEAKRVIIALDQTSSERTALWAMPDDADVYVLIAYRTLVRGVWVRSKDQPLTDEDVTAIVAKFNEQFPAPVKAMGR